MKINARSLVVAATSALIVSSFVSTSAEAGDYSQYSGAQLYTRFCASCHGREGLGDGPVASSLGVLVPDLTEVSKRHGGSFPEEQIMRIIDGRQAMGAHGSRTMPVWGYEFQAPAEWTAEGALGTSEPMRKLAQYIRSLQKTPQSGQ